MTAKSNAVVNAVKASWLPLVIIVLAQLQMGININALPVSLGPIIEDINAPATSVATALVLYSLFVAAFVMLGAKIGKMFGERLVFQISALVHGGAMALMAVSVSAEMMNTAQAIAGVAAAALVPTLVVLIAANYRERQQEQALGILASYSGGRQRADLSRGRLHRHGPELARVVWADLLPIDRGVPPQLPPEAHPPLAGHPH